MNNFLEGSFENQERFISQVNFGELGLIPAIIQNAQTDDVLMLAWMNAESLSATLREHRTVFWSRSRQELWRKGETSGNIQELVSIALDCDGDTLLVRVNQSGPACHTGSETCFSGRSFSEVPHD